MKENGKKLKKIKINKPGIPDNPHAHISITQNGGADFDADDACTLEFTGKLGCPFDVVGNKLSLTKGSNPEPLKDSVKQGEIYPYQSAGGEKSTQVRASVMDITIGP